MIYDFCVVGGGIVGLATAAHLLRSRPGAGLVLLEKEDRLARHQTGHNSGVIHSGIYYQPGSLKAQLCRRGAQMTKEFCREQGIPFTEQGKLLVATDARDAARMAGLVERASRNGIAVEPLSATELNRLEPNVSGVGALLVPATGSVDYVQVCAALARAATADGAQVRLGVRVTAIRERDAVVSVTSTGPDGEPGRWTARRLVVCGGLQADRLAMMAGLDPGARIVPFRGEYYRLPSERAGIVRHLIYPVPDPDLPFLGVHLTPMVDGRVTVGPNAVLGLSREGYRKLSVSARDVRDIVTYPGFWNLARSNLRTAAVEIRNSVFRRGYLQAARRYCPGLQLGDLLPEEAGIRAQAVLPDGTLVHDFLFAQSPRTLHVLNAPSPAATSALPIGALVAQRCLQGPDGAATGR